MGIRIGRPDVRPDAPSHTKGVNQGNSGPNDKQRGHNPDGTVGADRSTGINPQAAQPIDPRMPNLPPA